MFDAMVRCTGALLVMLMLGAHQPLGDPCHAQTADPVLAVDVTVLAFAAGDTLKTVTVTNAGEGTLPWSIAVEGEWMSVDHTSGSLEAGMSQIVTVSVDRSQVLIVGVLTGRIMVSSEYGDEEIAVSAVVAEHPLLEVGPAPLNFGSEEVISELVIRNRGSVLLTWSSAEQASWISMEPVTGSVEGGGADTVYVMVDRSAVQDWGIYTDTITITSDGGESAVTVTMEKRNHPPDVPAVVSPADGMGNQPLAAALSCQGGDRDEGEGDSVTYDIFLSRDKMMVQIDDISTLLCSRTAACYCDVSARPLRENTTYHWKVLARDSHDEITPGSVWSFTTQKNAQASCPAALLGLPQEDMQLLRRLREEILSCSAPGRRYIASYYRYAWELSALLLLHGELRGQTVALYEELRPVARSLLENGEAGFSQNQLEEMSRLLEAFSLYARPTLKALLMQLTADLLDSDTMESLGIVRRVP